MLEGLRGLSSRLPLPVANPPRFPQSAYSTAFAVAIVIGVSFVSRSFVHRVRLFACARRKEKDLLHHLWILYSSFALLVQTSYTLCVVYLYFNQEVCYWVTCNGKISFLFFLYRARSNTIQLRWIFVLLNGVKKRVRTRSYAWALWRDAMYMHGTWCACESVSDCQWVYMH